MQDYAKIIFKDFIPSNQGIKKAIKKGAIRVDGQITTTGLWIEPQQKISLLDLEETPPKRYELPLEVVYEDEHLAVINKPAGIVVSGNQFKTIQNALLFNLKPSGEKDMLPWPLPVHRLDAATSGLLLIAKTKQTRIDLGRQFENKTIQKRYRAIVIGKTPDKGKWDSQINEQSALTEFTTLQTVPSLKNEWLSLLDLFPHTGRTHQLRIHLSSAGFPILGDKIYGTEGNILKGKGLFLSAVGLSFIHPVDHKKVSFDIKMPSKFHSLIKREEKRWKKYN